MHPEDEQAGGGQDEEAVERGRGESVEESGIGESGGRRERERERERGGERSEGGGGRDGGGAGGDGEGDGGGGERGQRGQRGRMHRLSLQDGNGFYNKGRKKKEPVLRRRERTDSGVEDSGRRTSYSGHSVNLSPDVVRRGSGNRRFSTSEEYPEVSDSRVRRLSSLSAARTPFNSNHSIPSASSAEPAERGKTTSPLRITGETGSPSLPSVAAAWIDVDGPGEAAFAGSLEGFELVSRRGRSGKHGAVFDTDKKMILSLQLVSAPGGVAGPRSLLRSESYSESAVGASSFTTTTTIATDRPSLGMLSAHERPFSAEKEVRSWMGKSNVECTLKVFPRAREPDNAFMSPGPTYADFVLAAPGSRKYISSCIVNIDAHPEDASYLSIRDLSLELSSVLTGSRALFQGSIAWKLPSDRPNSGPRNAVEGTATLTVDQYPAASVETGAYPSDDGLYHLVSVFDLMDSSKIQVSLVLPSLGTFREDVNMSRPTRVPFRLVVLWTRDSGTSTSLRASSSSSNFHLRVFDPVAHPSSSVSFAISSHEADASRPYSLSVKAVVSDIQGTHKFSFKFGATSSSSS